MSETREPLQPGVEGFKPMPDAIEQVLVQRDRKQPNRRVAAGILGIAILALAAIGLARLITSQPQPALPEPTPPAKSGDRVVFTAAHIDPDPEAPVASRGDHFEIYVGRAGGSARLLVGLDGDETAVACPTFSPDGSLLAYGEKRSASIGGEMSIVVRGSTFSGQLTGPEIRIPVPAGSNVIAPCPAWDPDGQSLASIAPGLGVLFADLEGTTRMVRFKDGGLNDGFMQLEWSPDGSQVAVLLWTGRFDKRLWIVPADGGAARRVADFHRGPEAVGEDADTIAWAPDGHVVVVGGYRGWYVGDATRPFVKAVDAVSGDASEVSLPKGWKGSVDQLFSTGGDRFLVERNRSAPEWLDLQGNVTPISDLEYPINSSISLSPDGKQILYVTYAPKECPGQFIVAVPLDGGTATRYSPCTNGFGDNYSTFAWQAR
jgi:hypothetical protein